MAPGKNTKKSNLTITVKELKKYLNTFEETYFDNAVDSVIKNSGVLAKVSRYTAWDFCYIFFSNLRYKYSKPEDITEEDMNLACLNLYSYLASWGMTRNSFMGNYNYKMFSNVVKVIFRPVYRDLWYLDDKLRELNNIYKGGLDLFLSMSESTVLGKEFSNLDMELDKITNLIYVLGLDIKDALSSYACNSNKNVTDTLITKIMLGTLGCMPGLDSNFKKAIAFSGDSFTEKKIKIILLLIIYNLSTLSIKQNYIKDSKYQYPFMKLLDIYYFEKGK